MEITQVAYTAFQDQDDRLSIRTKINSLGANVVDLSTEAETSRAGFESRVSTNESDIEQLQLDVLPLSVLSVGSQSSLPTQALVANVPAKLEWITAATLTNGTAISYSANTNEITVLKAGVYKIYGTMSFDIDNNHHIEVELYVNGVASGMKNTVSGMNNFSSTIPYIGISTFNTNDVLSLYITSTDNSIVVDYANVIVEETNY